MATFFEEEFSRRQFIAGSIVAMSSVPMFSSAETSGLTVQQLIDLILAEIPGKISSTVDTIKIGDPNQQITSVVTTMFPTIAVINQAIKLKANFIIVHEPSFYNHADDTSWLEGDEVFQYKKALLEKNGIAVWRFHDYMHRHNPDGILQGVVDKLQWKRYQTKENPAVFNLGHPSTVGDIVRQAKASLGIKTLRVVGNLDEECQRILLLPGAWGGRNQITQMMHTKPDLLIVGEVSEWETSEYVRDARAMGLRRSLIVLGHAQSEEPGMEWLVPWMKEKIPSINAVHIPSQNPFTFA